METVKYACPSSIRVREANPCQPTESTEKGLGRQKTRNMDGRQFSRRLIILKDSIRLMFLFSIAGNAWGGENLGRFLIWFNQKIDWLILVCDTKAPGCSKLCTNEFFPFSPIALWKLQMLGVSLPIIIFVSYSEPLKI